MGTLNKPKSRQERIILNFVKVVEDENGGDSCEEIIDNLKQTARDLKLLKEGKLETRPARELLKNEV